MEQFHIQYFLLEILSVSWKWIFTFVSMIRCILTIYILQRITKVFWNSWFKTNTFQVLYVTINFREFSYYSGLSNNPSLVNFWLEKGTIPSVSIQEQILMCFVRIFWTKILCWCYQVLQQHVLIQFLMWPSKILCKL